MQKTTKIDKVMQKYGNQKDIFNHKFFDYCIVAKKMVELGKEGNNSAVISDLIKLENNELTIEEFEYKHFNIK